MAERKRRAGRQPHQSEILEHEVTLYKGLQFSPQEFYARVEKALKDRQIPDIVIERVDWPEGGVLSPKREYLRASREHVVFDICAAPFGTGFFISTWFDVRPPNLGLPAVLLFIAMLIAGAVGFFGPSRLKLNRRSCRFSGVRCPEAHRTTGNPPH